jgi:anti-sigma-K factor RskA
MTDTNHERWSDDLAAYMLGALDPEETAELERHAVGCERCRNQIRWLTPAVQALPDSVERLEPPQELRSRILAEVRSDAAGEARRSGARQGSSATLRERHSAWPRGSGSGPVSRRPALGLAALTLIVAAVAGYAIGGSGGSGDGASTSTVAAVGHPPGITAEVLREGDQGTLRLANVAKLPDNRVLEAWVRREGEVEPVRELFVPDHSGSASTTIGDMRHVDLVMVTTEPAGGSEAPTSSPIVKVPIPVQ